jgi:16S rRNA (cytosine1402-N4)-methyltransferase
MSSFHHVPVLFDETLELLAPAPGMRFIDCTLGGGGHASALLERTAPDGTLLALDRDPSAITHAEERLAAFGERLVIRKGTFDRVVEIARREGFEPVDGILADVGTSSPQLDTPERGFSFQSEGPLDMRMDPSEGETALELVERLSTEELADGIYKWGDERRSRAIARAIHASLEAGELHTTADLRRAVVRVLGPKRSKIDPATRTFQALRIMVNDELGQLERLLEGAPELLRAGGVLAIISFHSHEDRLVKWAFREDPRLEPLTKKPVVASEVELGRNPRARPAKLRAARRVEGAS